MPLLPRFFEVTYDARGVVIVARTPEPFATLDEAGGAYRELIAHLEASPRRRVALLVDLRRAPARFDPEFEKLIAPLRKRLYAGFARCGALVASATGRLQVQRHASEDGAALQVFVSLEEALVALAQPSSRPRA